jgi:hypothetical protein
MSKYGELTISVKEAHSVHRRALKSGDGLGLAIDMLGQAKANKTAYERAAAEMHEELTNGLEIMIGAYEAASEFETAKSMKQLLERAKSL